MKKKNLFQVGVILTTKDYSIFKRLKGNRGLNEINVKRIADSMTESYLFTVVIVNEFMEVIDGQHRIEACKRLGLPVNYIIKPGLRLSDVQKYNGFQMQWNKMNYALSYSEAGIKSYMILLEFMKEYPDFNLGSAENLLTNTFDGANEKSDRVRNADGKLTGRVKSFQNGTLEISMEDKVRGYLMAAEIIKYKPYFRKFNSGVFVKTMISLFRNPKFDNDRMISQIQKNQTMMVQCATVKQYKQLMQDIYNAGKRYENRVALYV